MIEVTIDLVRREEATSLAGAASTAAQRPLLVAFCFCSSDFSEWFEHFSVINNQ